MDQTNIVVRSVKALQWPKIQIETNEAKRYVADLSNFKAVYCFPQDQKAWENVSVTASGFNLTWGTRFEVHVHQVIDSATSEEPIKIRA